MLNLVQLQERLKDVPMQALMQYANGANPQVPPFLALGELNRRKRMQEGAAAEQAKEMEGAPTVKQQIEQAAGLIALQGNRQQQASRQQAGIQAAMPMAAPNTTTSEPAQLAGGGFIEDIVVPRDYAPGGSVMNPEDLKRRMLREAMQGDVADIPKELKSAFGRFALRRRPGIAGVPLPLNMFKRSDYAGGGIVAFAAGSKDPIGKAPYVPEVGELDPFADFISEIEGMSEEERKKYLREKLERREKVAAGLKAARPQPASVPELPQRTYATPTSGSAPSATPPASKMGLGNISGSGLLKKFFGPFGMIIPELLFTSPEDVRRLKEAELRNRKDIPQATYSNEGTRYGPGGLDAKTDREPKQKPQGIQTLIPSSGQGRREASGAGIAAKTNPELEFLRKLYTRQTPDYEKELKQRGLDVRPRADKTIEELKRQREEVQGQDTFANRLLSLTPGRRFGMGQTGKGLMEFEKAQSDKLRQLNLDISKAEDLEARADYEFKRGNFDKAITLKTEADKFNADAAKSAGQIGVSLEQVAAQRAGTAAQIDATKEATRSRLTSQLDSQRLRALNQAFRPIDEQILKIQGIAALGSPLNPQQKAQLNALKREKALIEDKINRDYDQKIAALGGDGGYRVVGVRPGQ